MAAVALASLAILVTAGCDDDKTVTEEVYLYYNDIYGVVEYENDGDYPPPDDQDNIPDDNIMVTLFFGYSIDPYVKGDEYGFYVTLNNNEENFSFPFVPSGTYWLEAEFMSNDSCFRAETTEFTHTESEHSSFDLYPEFVGVNKPCWSVWLAGASENDYVQISEHCWVTKRVYEDFYKDRMENGELNQALVPQARYRDQYRSPEPEFTGSGLFLSAVSLAVLTYLPQSPAFNVEYEPPHAHAAIYPWMSG